MKIRDKEICGTFMVELEDKELIQVVAVQDSVSHYKKNISYTKKLRLESPEGGTVYPTEDPDIFKLSNGTILRRRRSRSSVT